MPTLTPTNPSPTRGLNHFDGAPLAEAETLTLARIQADDRAAFRAWIADIEARNGEARYKLAKAARLREEARKAAAPTPSPFPPQSPEKKERLKRAQLLKGANTREAARIAAESMTARGLFADLPAAMQQLARQVSESIPLPDAAPEHILNAWLTLDPNPLT